MGRGHRGGRRGAQARRLERRRQREVQREMREEEHKREGERHRALGEAGMPGVWKMVDMRRMAGAVGRRVLAGAAGAGPAPCLARHSERIASTGRSCVVWVECVKSLLTLSGDRVEDSRAGVA